MPNSNCTLDPTSLPQEVVEYEVNGVSVSMSPQRPSIMLNGAPYGGSFADLNVGLLTRSLETPTSTNTAYVRAVGQGALSQHGHQGQHLAPALVAGTSPLLLALQQNVQAPFFDPTDKDNFAKFARDWANWSK